MCSSDLHRRVPLRLPDDEVELPVERPFPRRRGRRARLPAHEPRGLFPELPDLAGDPARAPPPRRRLLRLGSPWLEGLAQVKADWLKPRAAQLT